MQITDVQFSTYEFNGRWKKDASVMERKMLLTKNGTWTEKQTNRTADDGPTAKKDTLAYNIEEGRLFY